MELMVRAGSNPAVSKKFYKFILYKGDKMFYSILKNLCLSRKLKLTNVLKELNISIGNTTKWKNGTLPNGTILIKFADYFNCSVDYLLGRIDNPNLNSQAETDKLII